MGLFLAFAGKEGVVINMEDGISNIGNIQKNLCKGEFPWLITRLKSFIRI